MSESQADDDDVPIQAELSYPAHAGYPVSRGFSVLSSASLEYWIARLREGFAEVEQIDGDISADGIGPLGGVGKP
jgi:hypothetical protein